MDEVDVREKIELFLTTIKSEDVQKRMIALLCKFVDISFTAGSVVCPILGPVHSIIKMFYPNYNQEEVQKNFLCLKRMINKIDSKVIESSLEERWNHIKTRFLEDVESIQLAVQTTTLVIKAKKKEFESNWMEELMDQGKKLMISLNHLLDGLTFEENQCEFNDQILIVFYNYTGGDKRKIEKLCTYFDQLLLNGLTSLCFYLTAKKDINWCQEVFTSLNYEQRLVKSVENMKSVLEKCNIECSTNLRKDATEILKGRGDVSDLLLQIAEKFFKKYYWMETFFILYNSKKSDIRQKDFMAGKTTATSAPGTDDPDGELPEDEYKSSGNAIIGHYVPACEEHNADQVDCTNQADEKRHAFFIFARRKPESTIPSVHPSTRQDVVKIVEESLRLTTGPSTAYRNIKRELDSKKILYWGLIVMRHFSHLWGSYAKISNLRSNESSEVVWVVKNKCTACVLLGYGDDADQPPEPH